MRPGADAPPFKLRRSSSDGAVRGCILSPCEDYRYVLWWVWDEFLPIWGLGLLNPSKATHEEDDNTVDRCVTRARRNGAGGIVLWNCGAIRETDRMKAVTHPDPIGPDNIYWIRFALTFCDKIIVGHGPDAKRFGGDKIMREALVGIEPLWCLRITDDGSPGHPLYIAYDQPLIPFSYGE